MEIVLVEGGVWVGGIVTSVDDDKVQVAAVKLSLTKHKIIYLGHYQGV